LLTKTLFTIAIIAVVSAAVCPTLPAAQFPPQVRESQQEKEMRDRQLKELNKRRQQDIRDDTTKLYQLATELKAAVDKTNENLLSLDVVRKADEVEKLAKRVKEKMKESIGPPPSTAPPSMVPTPHFP